MSDNFEELINEIRKSKYISEVKSLLKSQGFRASEEFNEVAIEIFRKIIENVNYIYDKELISILVKFFTFSDTMISSSKILNLIPYSGKYKPRILEDISDFYEDVNNDYKEIAEIFSKIKEMCQVSPILKIKDHPFDKDAVKYCFDMLK